MKMWQNSVNGSLLVRAGDSGHVVQALLLDSDNFIMPALDASALRPDVTFFVPRSSLMLGD